VTQNSVVWMDLRYMPAPYLAMRTYSIAAMIAHEAAAKVRACPGSRGAR